MVLGVWGSGGLGVWGSRGLGVLGSGLGVWESWGQGVRGLDLSSWFVIACWCIVFFLADFRGLRPRIFADGLAKALFFSR